MTRSQLLLVAAAATTVLGLAVAIGANLTLLGEDAARAVASLGLLTALAGVAALLAVLVAGVRRNHTNIAQLRGQLRRTGERLDTGLDRRLTVEDMTGPDSPVQRAIDEGRVELQAISEAAIETAIVTRQLMETAQADMEAARTDMEAARADSISRLRAAIDESARTVATAVNSDLAAAAGRGGFLQRLARDEATTLFTLVESLDKIHDELDLEAPLPPFGGWAIRTDLGALLIELLLDGGRDGIVDIGSGLSTLLLAAAARRVGRGHVVSVDHLPEYADATRRNLERLGLEDWATVHVAPLVPTQVGDEEFLWYDQTGIDWPDEIDLLFVDGPPASTGHRARYPAVPLLRDRLSDDAVVLLDDGLRPDEQIIGASWAEELTGSAMTLLPHAVGTIRLDVDGRSPA